MRGPTPIYPFWTAIRPIVEGDLFDTSHSILKFPLVSPRKSERKHPMKIDKEDVFEKMKSDKVIVLNILSKSDFKKLHIKGSESHPMTEDPSVFSKEVEGKYGKTKSFIVYGERFGLLDSYFASQALEEQGLKSVNYVGGVQEWYKAGLPVGGTETTMAAVETP